MNNISKVAVIGSGVMGGAIAAHIANSGTEVILLDIVPDGVDDRSQLAKGAIDRLLKMDPAPLTHKRRAKLITPGNLEDDLLYPDHHRYTLWPVHTYPFHAAANLLLYP